VQGATPRKDRREGKKGSEGREVRVTEGRE
jgi:hypothetical protein